MNKLGVFKNLVIIEDIKDHFKTECQKSSPKDWSKNS